MTAQPIAQPPAILSTGHFRITHLSLSKLFRVSSYRSGEPYFGRSGGNRFDAPGCKSQAAQYGACYLGYSLEIALAESLLHDEMPLNGRFWIANTVLAGKVVYRFEGDQLRLLNLTGATLKRLNGHGDLTGSSDYDIPQQWALAVFDNPAQYDGFIYASRHATLGKAVILFDRARTKVRRQRYTELITTPGYARAARKFGIVGI